jgi:hypothetical protein
LKCGPPFIDAPLLQKAVLFHQCPDVHGAHDARGEDPAHGLFMAA